MLRVQQLLLDNGVTGLAHLSDVLHIAVREKDHRVLLKYSQIDSPMWDPIVQECRGLILDRRDWHVVSWPFAKFFNYGDGHAAQIDLASAHAQEKIDGTCCDIPVQKDFALAVQAHGTRFSAPLYLLRSGRIKGIREWFNVQEPGRLADMLGVKITLPMSEGL